MRKTGRFFALLISLIIMLFTFTIPAFASEIPTVAIIGGGAGVVAVAVNVTVVVAKSKKSKKKAAPSEEPAVEEKAEEVPAEEPAAEEKAEEVPAEEPAAEEKAKEVPAEEPVVEEKAEEAPAEEPAVEEKAEEAPAEEPAVEEKVEEAPAEEPAAEEKVEEAPAEEPAAEEKAEDGPKTAVDPETGCVYTFNEKGIPVPPDGMIIRYKWSFLGRLFQSDAGVKFLYMTLRRNLLSYSKVRSNVSWNFDSYFIGRQPIVKLKVRGKNLVAYFPIDPKTMEGTKYVGEDVSKISRYKAVPFAYRINGTRKMKYAMELIAKLLEGVKSEEPEYIDISQVENAVPFETFDELYVKGYIKIGGFLAVSRSTVPADDDEEDEGPADTQVDINDDDDSAPLHTSTAPVKREEFNFNPKKG